MNWLDCKAMIENELVIAGISDKEFIKLFMKFQRRVNTCKNMLSRGASWDTMCYSNAYSDAWDYLQILDKEYLDTMVKFNEANGYCKYTELDSMIA